MMYQVNNAINSYTHKRTNAHTQNYQCLTWRCEGCEPIPPYCSSSASLNMSAKCHNPVIWSTVALPTLCVVRMFNLAPNPPLLHFIFYGHNLASLSIWMSGYHTRPSKKPPSLLQLLLHGQTSEASFNNLATYPAALTSNGISPQNLSLLPICTLRSGTKDFSG